MEKESFEDEEVAAILNEHYIAIKVDREERKDIDAIYMKACQVITGTGGWPLNLWLTPDKLPIYAGTYFPKKAYLNRTGLMDALSYIQKLFEEKPQALFNQSFEIITNLKKTENRASGSIKSTLIEEVDQAFVANFDEVYGGFSKVPKFPTPHQLLYLLESSHENLQDMAIKTATQMAKGGIYDHIGGGFSRYSVDERWLIPHFEKMLYDNGLLLDVYSKAYELTGDKPFETIVEETCAFLEREMRHEKGGFYSAYDADSEGIEGKYYRFTKDEIMSVLGEKDGNQFCDAYGITTHGNFEGYTILNLIDGQLETLQDESIKYLRNKLLAYRSQRIKPALDDKILSMSNGYVIHGLLSVYETFGWEKALNLAIEAQSYIHEYMVHDETLYASARDDQKGAKGTIEDYAAMIRCNIKLYLLTQNTSYLEQCIQLEAWTERLFWDDDDHGYFVGEKGSSELIFNPKELYDGATPSGNSLMVNNLLLLFLLTNDIHYKQRVDELMHFFGGQLNTYKIYASYFINAIRLLNIGTKEVRIVVPNDKSKELFLEMYSYKKLKQKYGFDVYHIQIGPEQCLDQHTTVYLCKNGVCDLPILFSD